MKNEWKKEQHRQRKLADERLKKENHEIAEQLTAAATDYREFKRIHPEIIVRDLSGFIFDDLTVIKKVKPHITPSGQKIARYLCRCSCGDTLEVYGFNLTYGGARNCGGLIHSEKEKVELPKQLTTPDRELDPSTDLSFQPIPDHHLL